MLGPKEATLNKKNVVHAFQWLGAQWMSLILHYTPNHLVQESGSHLRQSSSSIPSLHTQPSQFVTESDHVHFPKISYLSPSSKPHNSYIHAITQLSSPAPVSLAPMPPSRCWLCVNLSPFTPTQTLITFFTISWNKFKFLNKILHSLLLAHLTTCPEVVLHSDLWTQTQEPGN